jgi:hypothetical protein
MTPEKHVSGLCFLHLDPADVLGFRNAASLATSIAFDMREHLHPFLLNRRIEGMNRYINYCTFACLLMFTGPSLAEDGRGTEHQAPGMSMSDESMAAMHESMAALEADISKMRKSDSNDVKLRLMEKHMDQMTRHMRMMMDAMEGKAVKRHDHSKMKR